MLGRVLVEYSVLVFVVSSIEFCAVAKVGARIERTAMEQPSIKIRVLANILLGIVRRDLVKNVPQFWQKALKVWRFVWHSGQGVWVGVFVIIRNLRIFSENPRRRSIPMNMSTKPANEWTVSAACSPNQ